MRTFIALGGLLVLLAGCGKALTTPEDLPIRNYNVGDVKLTFVMTSCSDTCSAYEDHACSLLVDADTQTVEADVSVAVVEKPGTDGTSLDNCSVRCGNPVLVHCDPVSLTAGKWMVNASGFTDTIVVGPAGATRPALGVLGR
jgi:hypothetical protein